MATFLRCEGEILIVDGQPSCSAWQSVTEEELLNQALANHLLSRDDFNQLSAWILAIMIAAMGLRLILKTLNIGEKPNEKN
ncbi:hypothetical protein [Cellvibrio sp.]|uniref:hypothetical protein n=1 Tax=Cellvibrio sp. TaxID=1965322 RepID=UPI0039647830